MYSKYFYSAEANELFTERQIITEMLRFEAGLAKAQSKLGIVPEKAAEIIENCCRVEFIDANLLQSEIILGGNAAIPLVKQLTRIVKNNDVDASKYVHLGATSQDVVDTATALQIQKYGIWLEEKLDQLISILTKLTQNHRNTLMIGRTLLQQAKPITFGLKTAGWLEA
ncbi:MAG: lyase family protein, partial [Bacteroidota bacterium]